MAPADCELCVVETNQRSTEIMVHSSVCTLVVIGLVIFNTEWPCRFENGLCNCHIEMFSCVSIFFCVDN